MTATKRHIIELAFAVVALCAGGCGHASPSGGEVDSAAVENTESSIRSMATQTPVAPVAGAANEGTAVLAASVERIPPIVGEDSPNRLMRLSPLARASVHSGPLFERLDPKSTGIDAEQRIDINHKLKRLYVATHACGGLAIGDVNGDKKSDIYVVNNSGENRLYLQQGDFQFADVTETSGVAGGDAWGAGAAMVDIDGDSDLDIYVCNYESPNQLFINNGENPPAFTEQAAAFGLALIDACVMPYFCDYDRDGDLDVYVVCYRLIYPTGVPDEEVYVASTGGKLRVKTRYERYYDAIRLKGKRVYVTERGCVDYLLRNDGPDVEGDIRFTDVTKRAGINGELMGISAAWWDYDEDGYPDLYVANDFEHADRFYRNRGDGTFENAIRSILPHTAYTAMGSSLADIDGNGHLDLFVLDMASTTHFKEKVNMGEMGGVQEFVMDFSEPRQIMRNALYLNNGLGRMSEAAILAGLAKSDWSWSPLMEDFDTDGLTDVLITNGMSRNLTDSDVRVDLVTPGKTEWDHFESEKPYLEQNLAMRNEGDLRFANVSDDWGFDQKTMSFASATADFDGDGDLDVVMANLDEAPAIYRNHAKGNRLVVALQSSESNTFGIGSRVEIETAHGNQVRQIAPMRGFAATSEAIAHFGLGDAAIVSRLTVTWPDGKVQTHSNVPANHRVTIAKDSDAGTSVTAKSPTQFVSQELYGVERHVETPFDDFAHQPLLPNRYSQLGPCAAWGDVDGDGVDELFIGGAAGTAGGLYRRKGAESFELVQGPFAESRDSEDMGALFFDADGDGDQDLYVASGSYEFASDDPLLQDRLYINDGGELVNVESALPDMLASSSVVATADIDRDGDLDLFVGSRVVPREYPVVPQSRLLINESQPGSPKFVDATREIAKDLAHGGLVTSAVWSDANGDGWIDLLVTHEWGPVKFYANREGTLTDRTEAVGLAKYNGWWNGIAARDFDSDGDIDYVATNFGLNTKYRASQEKPVYVYFGDYGGNGRMNIVEAKASDGGLLPVRGKSCSSNAMPHLKNRFKTFREFATASLNDIYTDQCLGESLRHEANTLESGVFINNGKDGNVAFRFEPLPLLAQIAPGFGVVSTEINGDAHPDIYLVHNFHTPQRETGRMDGGVSSLLVGHGDGTFRLVPTEESGLLLPGDAKALTVVDLNDDCQPDFVATRNNDKAKAFVSTQTDARWLRLSLVGDVANAQAIGARVTVRSTSGVEQTAEVSAGGGYLSQSAAYLFFGVSNSIDQIEVRWPDGTSSTYPAETNWKQGGSCVLTKESTK